MRKSKADREIEKEAQLDAVGQIAKNISNDFKTLRSNGKNPEPEFFYENWIKLNLSKKFPKKYYSLLWKGFINSLAVKR